MTRAVSHELSLNGSPSGAPPTVHHCEKQITEVVQGTLKRKQRRHVSRPCSGESAEKRIKDEKYLGEMGERKTEMLGLVHDKMDSPCKFPGIPLVPSDEKKRPGVVFVLEKASLVLAYVGKKYQILNPDDHAGFLRKKNLNPYDYRPDIVHQALLQIQTSRLCMAGMVQAIYVKTDNGILIKIEPNARIPETFDSFCAMMSELLQKFSIKAKGNGHRLISLLKNPVTQYLPFNSVKIGLSFSSSKEVLMRDYVRTVDDNLSLVFVVGTMAHGKIDTDWADDVVSVSEHPLSAAVCLRIICVAVEKRLKIL